jgi:23S rRNA (cytidine2498-2'-O)-methyltransferase
MTPERVGAVDWLLSDVICYPDKLFEFIGRWAESGLAKRMVITIKFQGEADPAIIEKFQTLGRVLHLAHNKHELTFLR